MRAFVGVAVAIATFVFCLSVLQAQTSQLPPHHVASNTSAISTSQINLSWNASTDNVGVTGYKIYRDGTLLTTVTTTSYQDTGLTSSTQYSYTVSAIDAIGNASAQSASVSAITQAQSVISGLDFPGSAAVTTTMRFRFLNPLSIYPATYIWHAYPRRQTYYYTTFFWGNDDGHNDLSTFLWDGGNSNTFYGAHPYPIGPSYTSHKWEIATDIGGDFLSPEDVLYDRWYTQALVAWADGNGNKHTDFYWDLPDTSKLVTHTTTPDYGNINPPVPALTFGDAPWNPGNEVYDGILRGIRVYSTNLSVSDILSEASSPLSTSAGAAKIWYLNMNPTPTDISDKSSAGHNPSWVGSERPSLYMDSGTPTLTPPSAPSGLSVSAISTSQINLSWNASRPVSRR